MLFRFTCQKSTNVQGSVTLTFPARSPQSAKENPLTLHTPDCGAVSGHVRAEENECGKAIETAVSHTVFVCVCVCVCVCVTSVSIAK